MMKKETRRRLVQALVSAMLGGSLFTSCDTRFREAAVSGATNYFLSLLDPTTIIESITNTDSDAEE